MKIRSGRTWWSSVMNLFEGQPTEPGSVLSPTESTNSPTVMESSVANVNRNPDNGQPDVQKNGASAGAFHQKESQRISFEGEKPVHG